MCERWGLCDSRARIRGCGPLLGRRPRRKALAWEPHRDPDYMRVPRRTQGGRTPHREQRGDALTPALLAPALQAMGEALRGGASVGS
jgi:hypothetical protein